MSKVLIIISDNDLLYCYKADTKQERSAGIYDYLESNGFDSEEYKDVEPRLVESYLNKSDRLYADFGEAYFKNFCDSYEIETIMEPILQKEKQYEDIKQSK